MSHVTCGEHTWLHVVHLFMVVVCVHLIYIVVVRMRKGEGREMKRER